MNSWYLQNNSLMDFADSKAIEPKLGHNLKNTLKTVVKIQPITYSGSASSVYGKNIQFKLPRAYSGLAQVYIKCTLSTGSVASVTQPMLATKIFSSIVLSTMNETQLQAIAPQYTNMRVENLTNTQMSAFIQAGIEPDVAFTNASVTCIVPCFFFFSDDVSNFLDTRNLEQLVLNCKVNADYSSMGMSVALTSASYELYAVFHDTMESNNVSDLSWTVKPKIPKIIRSYNAFYEEDVNCPINSTSATILLRNIHPCFVLHLGLYNSGNYRKLIKTATINVAGNELMSLDYRMNYQMYASNNSFSEADTLSIWLNKTNSRLNDTGLTTFSGSMFPTYVTITFDALDAAYTFKVFEEYRTMFSVTEKGFIRMSTDDEYKNFVKWDQQASAQTLK